jgi:hypothetical protein
VLKEGGVQKTNSVIQCTSSSPRSHSYSSSEPIPAVFRAHSTASLRSQKYSRINVLIISSAETAELLLQNFSCRSQGVLRQNVSGKRCLSAGRRFLGAAALLLCKMGVCARCRIPETMLMMAIKFGLEHWVVRNEVASDGS